MAMVDRLDAISLRELSRRTDTLGVLSVYVNADPQDPNLRGAAIDLKNRFTELQRRIREDRAGNRSRDVAPNCSGCGRRWRIWQARPHQGAGASPSPRWVSIGSCGSRA